jgi:hypothetical protein
LAKNSFDKDKEKNEDGAEGERTGGKRKQVDTAYVVVGKKGKKGPQNSSESFADI